MKPFSVEDECIRKLYSGSRYFSTSLSLSLSLSLSSVCRRRYFQKRESICHIHSTDPSTRAWRPSMTSSLQNTVGLTCFRERCYLDTE